jgi:hypothetical protein
MISSMVLFARTADYIKIKSLAFRFDWVNAFAFVIHHIRLGG